MDLLFDILKLEIWLILCAFAVTVAWKLITRRILMAGLITKGKSGPVSAFKTQKLAATLTVAMLMMGRILSDPSEFPEVPREFVAALGASNLLYLFGKKREISTSREVQR